MLYTEHLVLDLVFIFILNVYSYKQTPYSRLFSYGVQGCIQDFGSGGQIKNVGGAKSLEL